MDLCTCVPFFPHSYHKPCPSYLRSLGHCNSTYRRLQVMELLTMQPSPASFHFISLRSKYSPCSSLFVGDQVSHQYRTTYNILVLYILFFMFSDCRRKQNVLDWTVASNTRIQSPTNLLVNKILICYYRSQVLELCHVFMWSVCYLYIMILTCILVMKNACSFTPISHTPSGGDAQLWIDTAYTLNLVVCILLRVLDQVQ
jgi:hypothetical protein